MNITPRLRKVAVERMLEECNGTKLNQTRGLLERIILARYCEFMARYKIGRPVLFLVLAPSCDGQAERFQDKSS